jgi:hypothetical protein
VTRQAFITAIAADLKTWSEADRGYFCVAEDPTHPYAVLASGNVNKWACILSFAGDNPAGEELPGNIYRPRVEVFVGHCVDLRKDPGAWLHVDASSAANSLLARVDALDKRLLTMVFAAEVDGDDTAYAAYGGSQQVTLPGAGIPLRAWRLSYSWTLRLEPDAADYRFLN